MFYFNHSLFKKIPKKTSIDFVLIAQVKLSYELMLICCSHNTVGLFATIQRNIITSNRDRKNEIKHKK